MPYELRSLRKFLTAACLLIACLAGSNLAFAVPCQEEQPAEQPPVVLKESVEAPPAASEIVEAEPDAEVQEEESGDQKAKDPEVESTKVTADGESKAAQDDEAENKEAESTEGDDPATEEADSEEQKGETKPGEEAKTVADESEAVAEVEAPSSVDSEATEESLAMSMPASDTKILTPEQIRWIWKLIFVFLGISFLLWLLSLMSNGSTETPDAASSDSQSSGDGNTSKVTADPFDFGKVYSTRPKTVDDLTKIGGIDAAAEKRLNDAGIWQYDQLRGMTAQQRANLQRKLNLPRIRWYSLSGLGSASAASVATESKNDLNATNKSKGSTQRESGTENQSSSSVRVDSGASQRSELTSNSNSTSDSNSALSGTHVPPPNFRDDLTRMPGVDAKLAAEMNKEGIYSFKQLQAFSPVQKLAFEKRFGVGFDKLKVADFAAGNAVSAGQGGSVSASAGSSAVAGSAAVDRSTASDGSTNSSATNSEASSDKDTVSGAGAAAAAAGALGAIAGAAALANNDSAKADDKPDAELATGSNADSNRSSGSDSSSAPDSRSDAADRSEPAPESGKAETPVAGFAAGTDLREVGQTDSESKANSSEAATQDASGTSLEGVDPQSQGRVDETFGFVYTTAPLDPDDLTQLDGINAEAAQRLNAAGIYKIEQFENLDDQTKSALARRFRIRDVDVSQWRRGAGRTDDTFGFLFSTPPADADDLSKLAGIDEATAKRLNEAGIYKFEQLAKLDEKQAAELSSRFQIPDADFADWRRCFYAWGRGIHTTADEAEVLESGLLNGIELPKIADGVFDGAKLVAYPEQVIFRGSNPEGWGTGNEGIDGVDTSLGCDSIRSNINYLRIRRTDTRESVVVPMTKGQIFSNGDPGANGWNGSSEVFFGGRHIGVFAQHLPQEVETKFSQGGWGFGHRYDHNDRQEWGWAGRVVEPTTFEVSVGCIGETPGTVVFRSSDPTIWNTRTRDDASRFADPVSSVQHPVNFVRIMREATGEAVIIRVDGKHVLDEGFDPRCGWNGSCSEFSGGRHLGVYHSDLPQDFETRFEFGGWGFGHPYDDNDRQAWGWAGRQLPETVFEISLLESVPDFMKHEVIE